MKANKRMIASIAELIIGVILCAVYFAGKADEYWNGMGAALIAVGAIRLVNEIRYRRDENYRKEVDVAAGDERNRYISLRSWAWAGYCFVIVAAAVSIIFKITGNDEMCLTAAMGACLLMVMYAAFYFILRRKY